MVICRVKWGQEVYFLLYVVRFCELLSGFEIGFIVGYLLWPGSVSVIYFMESLNFIVTVTCHIYDARL